MLKPAAIWRHGILLLLTSTLFGCAALQTQQVSPQSQLFENANTVVVRTSDEPEQAFNTLLQILYDHGFRIHATDSHLYNIETASRTISGPEGILYRRVFIDINDLYDGDGSEVRITGRYDFQDRRGNRKASNEQLRYDENAPNIFLSMWEELNHISRAYEDGEVLFARL